LLFQPQIFLFADHIRKLAKKVILGRRASATWPQERSSIKLIELLASQWNSIMTDESKQRLLDLESNDLLARETLRDIFESKPHSDVDASALPSTAAKSELRRTQSEFYPLVDEGWRAVHRAIEMGSSQNLSNQEAQFAIQKVFNGAEIATTTEAIGVIIPWELFFERGLYAAVPALKRVLGGNVKLAVDIGTRSIDGKILKMVEEALPAGEEIIMANSIETAAKDLRILSKVGVVKYVTVNGSQLELARVTQYVNEVIDLSERAFQELLTVAHIADVVQLGRRAYLNIVQSA